MEIAVIDLETTGFSPNTGDRIIEIGIVFLDEKLEQVRTFQSFVNPECQIRNSVHGISNNDLAGQPTFSELFSTLVEQLRSTACLVAHNLAFEKRFLHAEFGTLNFKLPDRLQEICTMKAARKLRIGSDQKLETLINELSIEISGPSHRALPDALATAELLRHLERSHFMLPTMRQTEWTTVPIDLVVDTQYRGPVKPPPRSAIGYHQEMNMRHGKKSLVRASKKAIALHQQSMTQQESKLAASSSMVTPNISRPVQILISKLGIDGNTAVKAAEALIDQARRHASQLDDAVEHISPFLHSDNFNVRAAVAKVLGHIGTPKSIKAIFQAFEACPAAELATDCNFSCWVAMSLSKWFAAAIAEHETKLSAKTLVSLLSSKSLPDASKAAVMDKLGSFDLDELNVKLPGNIVEILEKFAASDDPEICDGAINMLGKV